MTEIISPTGSKAVSLTTVHDLPFVCPDDLGIGGVIERGEYEPDETHCLCMVLKPKQVVVDVGANIGYFTLLFAKMVGPEGRVFAFEPDPFNQIILHTNVVRNNFKNVEIYDEALGDCEKEGKLYLNPDNYGDHRTWNDGKKVTYIRESLIKERNIQITTLDKVLSNVPNIDVLKVDVQGDEEKVLRGARSIISRSPEMILTVEFWPYGLTQSGNSSESFLNLLFDMEFSIGVIEKDYIEPVSKTMLLDYFSRPRPEYELFNLLCSKKR